MSIRASSLAAAITVICTSLGACSGGAGKGVASGADTTAEARPLPDTLRVATLYSPTSYFIYRDQEMGYDYTLISDFARDKGMVLDLKIAPSLPAMIAMLDSGKVDILAYEIPQTSEFKQSVLACGPVNLTHQVLVQPARKAGVDFISDETQLVGRDVYVEEESKYQYRMENLNQELGGGVRLHTISRDTLITEDLIAMVSKGEIPLTVVDSDIARLNKTYYPDLDVSLALSFDQKSSWGVSPSNKWLADSVNAWIDSETPKQRNAELLKRYFELSKKQDEPELSFNIDFAGGKLSPYDSYFMKYGRANGVDWRMLAGQCYAESRFRNDLTSWAGARGIMQLMPVAWRAYGLRDDEVNDPERSIDAGARIMRDLDKQLAAKVPDPEERRKFAIAAYNSGLGHILDAIALANKYGKNPQVWDGNVESALLMKSNPEYYTDPVVKSGYCRSRETVHYVKQVMEFYHRALLHTKA